MSSITYHASHAFANIGHTISLSAVANRVHSALARRQSRLSLASLDAHLLADIGLTREQALVEAAKSIWED